MNDTFANRLKEAMTIRNIKPSELSRKTKIQMPLISNYLSGRYKAKQNRVYILAEALGVDEAWLMGCDVPMERTSDDKRKTNFICKKIEQLSDEQKDIIIKMIDNMK